MNTNNIKINTEPDAYVNTSVRKLTFPFFSLRFKVILFAVVTILAPSRILSQTSCEVEPSTEFQMLGGGGGNSNPECGDFMNYIPDSHTQMKFLKVNVHFMQTEDVFNPMNFASNWDGVNAGSAMNGDAFANLVINTANQRLSANHEQTMPPGNNTPVIDRKYRYVLKGVYYHASNTYWNNTSPTILRNQFGVNVGEELNIFFVSHPINGGGISGGKSFYSGDRACTVIGAWNAWQLGDTDCYWLAAYEVMHETGHSLSLRHPHRFDSGPCDNNWDDFCTDTPTRGYVIQNFGIDPCCGSTVITPQCCNNMMNYSADDPITPQQLARVHYTLTHDMIEYLDKDTYCYNDPAQIETIGSTENLIWNNIRILRGDLILESGAKLTIRCTVFMPEKAKIIVKPGARLTIDGGTITHRCGALWEGIEVWGNANLPQTLANQGYVLMINNATIEYARTAIRTIKNTGPTHYSTLDWSKTGGIVRCSNSYFINNLKGVEFMSYHNKNSLNQQINNTSYFFNCVFETNSIANFGGLSSTTGISMWDVNGIRFYGCTMDYLVPVESVSERGNGIVSAKSTFRVQDLGTDRCVFQNLNRAIDASGPMKGFYPYIDHAQFINNRGGVLLTGFGLSQITRNDFNFVEIDEPGDVATYGVYLQECQGYKVEENHFDGSDGIMTFGIAVNNSGNHETEIYKNYFTNLHAASMVYQDNRKEFPQNTGLQRLCNEYGTSNGNNGNTYQIGVWGEMVPGVPSSQGFYQGTNPNVSAGNKFWPDCTPNPNDPGEYPNERELKLLEQMPGSYYDYVHDFPAESKPECRTPGIGLIYTVQNNSNSCASKLITGPLNPGTVVASIHSKRLIEQQLATAYDIYANNGTGPQLRAILQDARKSSIEVRNALMDAAPKVTDDLLVMALRRQPVLEGWHMAQAMLANSPLRAGVMAELKQTDYFPFYIALVEAGQLGGLTTRQLMEMDYAHYLTGQHQEMDELHRVLFNFEEEEFDWNTFFQTNAEVDYLLTPVELAQLRAAEGDYAAARDLLTYCTGDELDYCDVVTLGLDMEESGMSETGLPNGVQSQLTTVAENPAHRMNATAGKLLEFWGNGANEEFLALPEGGTLKSNRISKLAEVELENLTISPNPAQGTVYAAYKLPEGWEKAQLIVYDNLGKKVADFNLAKFQGIVEMDTRQWSAGIHLIELRVDGIKTASSKLTVLH